MTTSDVVSVIAVIITGLVWWSNRQGIKAAAKKDDVDALRGIIAELKDYITELEADKEDIQAWAEKLVCQVKEAGLVPARFERATRPKAKAQE